LIDELYLFLDFGILDWCLQQREHTLYARLYPCWRITACSLLASLCLFALLGGFPGDFSRFKHRNFLVEELQRYLQLYQELSLLLNFREN